MAGAKVLRHSQTRVIQIRRPTRARALLRHPPDLLGLDNHPIELTLNFTAWALVSGRSVSRPKRSWGARIIASSILTSRSSSSLPAYALRRDPRTFEQQEQFVRQYFGFGERHRGAQLNGRARGRKERRLT